ncbi:MAG: protein kinase [Anaerolineae bacterium]|nr:protein kinase [Anaerolineae bacterium]
MTSVLYLIGKTLGKYEVLEHIGHGGMSEVYKGQHAQLDRMVAVKVLHPFLAGEEGFVTRFKREARIVATLRHPNIMQVYDFDYNDALDIYYMVMEYIDGPTLKTRLSEGLLPQEEAVRIGIAIADALDYAHQRGMVHRDVKPANIMFMQDGQPVLTDFGIAKMLTLSGLTASGAMVGTPAYMAPEVGMGRQGTAASDIYSLGVVLYQMLTGQLPFESDSPMGMVMQHINDTPPPLARFTQSVPKDFEAVVLKAMEKIPEERFGHAAEMAAALRRVVGLETYGGLPAVSPPPAILTPTSAVATPPPASRRPSREEEDVDDEDDRLLRTWPVAMDNKPSVRTPTLFPLNTTETPSSAGKQAAPRRRSFLSRLVGVTTFSLVGVIVGVIVWLGIRGDIPIFLQQLQTLTAAVRQPVTMDISPEPLATTVSTGEVSLATVAPTAPSVTTMPSVETTPVPEVTSVSTAVDETPVLLTLTPTPSEEASSGGTSPICTPRVRLDLVRQEPDSIVLPDTTVVVYLSARNVGNCTWPEDLRVAFVSGERMGAPDAISMQPLAAGASTQVIVPLHAPLDVGVYTSTWEVRQGVGSVAGTAIPVIVEVGEGPTPTPISQPTETIAPTLVPLTLELPTLVTWGEDAVSGTWYGTLALRATGGTSDYRYYRGEIQPETLLSEGQLTFFWRRCEALPLTVWVVSGADVVRWEGWIDYPAVQNCQ